MVRHYWIFKHEYFKLKIKYTTNIHIILSYIILFCNLHRLIWRLLHIFILLMLYKYTHRFQNKLRFSGMFVVKKYSHKCVQSYIINLVIRTPGRSKHHTRLLPVFSNLHKLMWCLLHNFVLLMLYWKLCALLCKYTHRFRHKLRFSRKLVVKKYSHKDIKIFKRKTINLVFRTPGRLKHHSRKLPVFCNLHKLMWRLLHNFVLLVLCWKLFALLCKHTHRFWHKLRFSGKKYIHKGIRVSKN